MRERRGAAMHLRDILDAMDAIESYVKGMTFEQFSTDRRTFDAVVRNLEVMGEAVKNLPQDLREGHPEVPWREVAGMRDKVAHAYFGVSHEIIWRTIRTRFGAFRKSIEGCLSGLE